MGVSVTTTATDITVSVNDQSISASVGGGIGPQGPAGPASTAAAGVSTLNGLTGTLTVEAGANITVTTGTAGLTITGSSGGSGAVSSVAGRTGAVVLTTADIGGYSAPPVTSVAGRTGAVTISTSDVSGYTAPPVTSVAGRTGAVTLTTADIGGYSSPTFTSLNGLTGTPSIVAGTNVTVTTSASSITVAAASGSSYTLPSATTTTLGGVIVPTSGGMTVDGSGNISNTVATTSQLRAATATGNVIDAASLFEAAWITRFAKVLPNTIASTSNATGTGSAGSAGNYSISLSTTSGGVGTARRAWANVGSSRHSVFNGTSNTSGDTPINFTKRQRLAFQLAYTADLSAGNAIRVKFHNTTSLSSSALLSSERGVELRIEPSRVIRLLAADGTTLTDSGSIGTFPSANIATIPVACFVELIFDGAGGCSAYLDGTLLGSVTGVSQTAVPNAHGYLVLCLDCGTTTQAVTVDMSWPTYIGFR